VKISVVIPCYGRCPCLGAQLEALARQEWSGEWEVILADNGMAAEVQAILDAYAQRLPDFRVIPAREKRGAAHARNRGADEASGDALIFVDSDDVVADGWLAAMAEALEQAEFCAPRFEYGLLNPQEAGAALHYAQEQALQKLWYPPWVDHAGGCGLGVWKATHERVGGFDEDLRWLQDTDYCIRLALGAVPLAFVRDAVIHIRLRESARARLRQARRWARANCELYSRYGRGQLYARHAWREYASDFFRLVRRAVRVRNRGAFLHLCARIGRQLGLLEGSLRYLVPPPVMPPERSITTSGPAPDGSPRVPVRTPLQRHLRSRLRTMVRVRTDERAVALTFDDGPDPEYTPRLLEILAAHGARATFFLIGERAERHPDIVRQIAEAGHAIGNHTYSHALMPALDPGEQAMELERCTEAIGEAAQRLFRPPFGQQSEASYRAARRAGYEVVGWSLMSDDWKRQESGELADRVLDRLEPGSIILMHDSLHEPWDPSAADRGYALDAVDQILERVGSYTRFVTLPELMSSGKVVRSPWFTRYRSSKPSPETAFPRQPFKPTVLEGRVKLGVFGSGEPVEPMVFTTEWVPGEEYPHMQDSDIRGFLDGGFRWAWNQPGQVHIRVGRLGWTRRPDRPPELGERELFRGLQRWERLDLPTATEILDASLTLQVEAGAARSVDVCLYEVFRDWVPGAGGVDKNNVSVPAPGELWWNETEAGSRSWSKPGAGHSGDPDSGADTAGSPLASTRYEPGDVSVTFRSPDFARYVQRRTSAGEPLLLLIKLSDADEDSERSVLTFWSAEHGDRWNRLTRPRLSLKWRSRTQTAGTEIDVRLEQGRALALPSLPGGHDRRVAVEWVPERPGWQPTFQISVRGEKQPWGTDVPTLASFPEKARIRLLAASRPLHLGEEFRSEIMDTWVISGPPEEQIVEWTFVSPSGTLHRLESGYRGGFRWEVAFRPREIGAWRYYWTHALAGHSVRGPAGRFDVVAGDLETVLTHLDSLAGEVSAERAGALTSALRSWEQRLMTLERAAVDLTPPAEWKRGGASKVRERVATVRAALWRKAIPDPQPMVSHSLITHIDERPLYDPYPDWTRSRRASPVWRRIMRRATSRMKRLRPGRIAASGD
jgi:peptidoglycan/xylan/chitin deacetylase (PgdA/CDA1 family)/glycosyltransferase involved in cell wall biosynthesis